MSFPSGLTWSTKRPARIGIGEAHFALVRLSLLGAAARQGRPLLPIVWRPRFLRVWLGRVAMSLARTRAPRAQRTHLRSRGTAWSWVVPIRIERSVAASAAVNALRSGGKWHVESAR